MNFGNLFRIALKALSNNKFRGFLTMLGIIIGVGSVITMLAIGQGSKRSIQAEISEMGSNNTPTSVYGVNLDYLEIRNYKVEDGDTFSEQDIKTAAKVCLIG